MTDYSHLYGKPLTPESIASAERIMKLLHEKLVLARVLPVIVVDSSTTVKHTNNMARVDSDDRTLFIMGGRDCELRRSIEAVYAEEFTREDFLGHYADKDASTTRLFNTQGVVTGRLSSAQPNISNIPRKGSELVEGKRVYVETDISEVDGLPFVRMNVEELDDEEAD